MAKETRPKKPVTLIAGPTGSGKSRLALAISQRTGAVIINADSMQVYRELRILTARPSPEDEATCPHELYGHIGITEPYSVARWLDDIHRVLKIAQQAGQHAIIVGGTGLYFHALTNGLAPVPEIPHEIREHWRATAETTLTEELHAQLTRDDPEMAARTRKTDTQRITRALEVFHGTGQSLAHWQTKNAPPLLPDGSYTGLVVDRPREQIYASCDTRFDQMLAEGALDEVRAVRRLITDPDPAKRPDPAAPAMRALGLAPLVAHIDGALDLQTATETAKRDTRHYVKRQLTWLKRNMIAWSHITTKEMKRYSGSQFPFIDI